MTDNQTNENGRRHPAHNEQPSAQPPMSEQERLTKVAGDKYVEKVAEDAADKTVDYATDDPQQKIDDAKEQARTYVDETEESGSVVASSNLIYASTTPGGSQVPGQAGVEMRYRFS
ncbi:hypothetical protein L218DRAFT_991604 [Marasmius fiardii PR-910]|nr:hypothetical protein L218DRAFT_991604 [Marasmius fiardii PR-910]